MGNTPVLSDFGKVRLTGFPAWITWLFVHIMFLIGFRNRLLVMIEWAWSYLTYERAARLITGDPHLPGSKEPVSCQEQRPAA